MVHRSQVDLILDEIIFKDRNKEYGAYEIRRNYNSNLIKSVAIAFLTFSLALALPKIIAYYLPLQKEIVVVPTIVLEPFDFSGIVMEKPIAPKVIVAPEVVSNAIPTKIVDDQKVVIAVVSTPNADAAINTEPLSGGNTGTDVMPIAAPLDLPVIDKPDISFEVYVGEKQIFNGGELNQFLGREIRYPTDAQNNHISGRVSVEFIIEKDGAVSNVKAVRRIGFGCDEEAERVIKMTSGMWTPGKNNGHAVRLKMTQPIFFKLPEY